MRTRAVVVLFALLLGLVVTPPVQAQEDPLSGKCIQYMADYTAMIYSHDTSQAEVFALEGDIFALEVNRHVPEGYVAFPTEGGFIIAGTDGWSATGPGLFLGMSLSDDGYLLWSVGLEDGPTLFLRAPGQDDYVLVGDGFRPSWGPGDQFAATIFGEGLEIFDLSEQSAWLIATDGFDAAWSPNGRYVAFDTSEGAIRLFDLESETYTDVTSADSFLLLTPVWADDQTLVVSGNPVPLAEGQKLALYTLRPFEGGQPQLLLEDPGHDLYEPYVYDCAGTAPAEPTPAPTPNINDAV